MLQILRKLQKTFVLEFWKNSQIQNNKNYKYLNLAVIKDSHYI